LFFVIVTFALFPFCPTSYGDARPTPFYTVGGRHSPLSWSAAAVLWKERNRGKKEKTEFTLLDANTATKKGVPINSVVFLSLPPRRCLYH
jgi:hypothetical protein